MTAPWRQNSRTVLVLAPTGRDGRLATEALKRSSIDAQCCNSLSEARGEAADHGAGALLVAEEAILRDGLPALCRFLDDQPPWSRLPVLLLGNRGSSSSLSPLALALTKRCSLTLLERPLSRGALVSAARAALDARTHQYAVRDYIRERDQHVEALQQSLREREALLGEIHHRVRNNLQMVHQLLDLERTSLPAEALPARARTTGRIRAMALVHEMMYETEDFERLALDRYVRRLCDAVASAAADGTTIAVRAEPVSLDLRRAVPLGLIVHETVTNALTHGRGAVPPDIRISTRDGMIEWCVRDHGPGLPPGVDPLRKGGVGGRLTRGLARQLGGRASYESGPDGTTFTLTLPLHADR